MHKVGYSSLLLYVCYEDCFINCNSSPVYWGILDLTGEHIETRNLFTSSDWNEMQQNFDKEVKLVETTVPNIVYLLFDRINEVVKNFVVLHIRMEFIDLLVIYRFSKQETRKLRT